MKGYRKIQLKLAPLSVTTIDFDGVNPNYFRIANGGNARLYCSLKNMPNKKLYDFIIEPNNTRMYCEDRGYPNLYIYNSSGSECDIIVTSFIETFSPEVMAFCDFNIAENEEQTINVEIGGFTESLPTGSNKIGKVDVASLPSTTESKLNNIKDYTSKLNDILSAIENIEISGGSGGEITGDVTVNTNWTEDDVISVTKNLPSIYGELEKLNNVYYKVPLSLSENDLKSTNDLENYVDIIKLLTNDGESDIKLTYNLDYKRTFILKSGESITDFGVGGYIKIEPNISGETILFRCLAI